jgi:hypothetical protein
MDSAIPISNSLWTYENQMSEHFYEPNLVAANATLDAARFIDTPDSPHPGWRYYDTNNNSAWDFGVDVDADGIAIEIMGPAGYCAAPPPSKMPLCGEIQASLVFVEGMELCDWEFLGGAIQLGNPTPRDPAASL